MDPDSEQKITKRTKFLLSGLIPDLTFLVVVSATRFVLDGWVPSA